MGYIPHTTFLARADDDLHAGQGVGRPDFATKIPVDKIAEEWRAQSSKGRYESAMWREAGLEEPGANLNAGAAAVVAEAEVDNLEAGGFFARFGREPTGPLPTVIPAHTGGTP